MNSQNYMAYENNDCQYEKNNAIRNNWQNRNCINTNSAFNYGESTNLRYDQQYIQEDIQQSTMPLQYVMDPTQVKNCQQCLSLNGPVPSVGGWGDSIPIPNAGIVPAQEIIDLDSILSNRNVKASKTRRGNVNDIDVFKFKTYNSKLCNKFLDPKSSLLTTPKQLYREMSINRFYNTNQNSQVNLYWNGSTNTQLEAKDNYDFPYPYSISNSQDIPVAQHEHYTQNNSPYKPTCSVNVMPNMALNNEVNFERKMANLGKNNNNSNNNSLPNKPRVTFKNNVNSNAESDSDNESVSSNESDI